MNGELGIIYRIRLENVKMGSEREEDARLTYL